MSRSRLWSLDHKTIGVQFLISSLVMLVLGGLLGMAVPWQLAWSCLSGGPRPCQACVACRRRRTSFEHAGMVDPVEKTLKPARV